MRGGASLAVVAALVLAGCGGGGDEQAGPAARPTHDHGAARVSLPVGDGTRTSEVGYSLREVRVPQRVGEPGRLSFVVVDFRGRPLTDYLTEQTKQMHVYVVRDDLAVFRHVHPQQSADGTWRGRLTLPESGRYRVVAEFVAKDEGGNGDHVLLGAPVTVPGRWEPRPLPDVGERAEDWGLEARVLGDLTSGREESLRVRLGVPGGGVPRIGQYLGTTAHLTGFHVRTGGAVHMHPLGEPVPTGDSVELDFHAELPEPGDYLLFLQVPVDDFLHTLPVRVSAG